MWLVATALDGRALKKGNSQPWLLTCSKGAKHSHKGLLASQPWLYITKPTQCRFPRATPHCQSGKGLPLYSRKPPAAKSLAFQATQNSYCKNQSPRHNNDIDNRITSSSVSSSGSPSKPLSSSSSPPIFSSPFTADGNV